MSDLSKSKEIEEALKKAIAKNENAEDVKMAERKKIKDGLSANDIKMVMKVCTDLILACTDKINFGIVFNSKSWLFLDEDAYVAWDGLRMKLQLPTNSQTIMLCWEFHPSKLGKASRSPDKWVEELEIICSRLALLGLQLRDEDLIM